MIRGPALGVFLATITMSAVSASGAGRQEITMNGMLRIVIHERKGNGAIEIPLALLGRLPSAEGDSAITITGSQGKPIPLPTPRLVQALGELRDQQGQVSLLTIDEEGGDRLEFIVDFSQAASFVREKRPTSIVVTTREGAGERTRMKMPLAVIRALGEGFSFGSGNSDTRELGGLVTACVSAAKDLGSGMILRISDQEDVLELALE